MAPRIVVPTATLVRHFQHELARDGVVCRPGSVVSFSRLAAELAPGVTLALPGLVRAVIRETLERLRPPAFAEAAKTVGMAAVVDETIGLFENAGCTPEKLLAVKGLQPRGRAFAQVWRTVDQAIAEAGFASRLAMFRAAAANAVPMHLWFDGFLHFSPLETELLEALAAAGPVTVTAPEYADGTLFDERTFGDPRKPRMMAVSADSVEREADEIARRIVELQSQGTPFREMGIALRDAATYEPLLRGTFERFGIPARFYYGRPLQGHPAAVFLGGLIDCALDGWKHREVLEALRADPRWGLTAAFDRFDFMVRERLPGSGVADLLTYAQDDYKRRVAECTAIRGWVDERATATEWAWRLEQFATRLYRPGRVEAPISLSDVETARGQASGLRSWIDAVTQVTGLWGKSAAPVTLAEYWRVAKAAVLESSYRTADDRAGVVHVMSVWEARQWDVAALFVCGMTNRDYPRRNAQNLLFPDAEIEALRKFGMPLRRSSDFDAEEDELWGELRCRARAELVVTWPRHDSGGKSVEPSGYLSDTTPTRAAVAIPAGGDSRHRGARGRIRHPELLEAMAAAHPEISVTAIEDLAQCRFKFFAGRTLKLRNRPERPEERLQPKVTGLILHEALEAWLNAKRAVPFVPLFEEAFEKACHERHLPAGYRLEVEHIVLRGIAERVSTTEQWKAEETRAEVEFKIPLTPTLTVNGRIDRIDRMNATDCVIVDYKSGRTARVEGFIHNKAKLQGPLYALAVRDAFGLRTIAMMYVAVREDKRFGWGAVPGSNVELLPIPPDWIENAREQAVQRVEGLLGGHIEALPTEEAECRYCDYRGACHVKEDEKVLIQIAGGSFA